MSTLVDIPIDLRPLRAVALQVLEACDAPETNASDISSILCTDAAMSMQLLKAANSPIYGYAGRVSCVEHATVILGFREVSKLSMAIAASELFDDGGQDKHLRQMLWDHSLGCACVARAIAKEIAKETAETAFLAGVVHDIGKLVILDAGTGDYEPIFGERDGAGTLSHEQEAYDITHTELGVGCGEEWGLPGSILDGIELHHDDDAPKRNDIVGIVAMANVYSRLWQLGSVTAPTPELELVSTEFEHVLTPAQLERVEKGARVEFEKMSQACSP